MADPKGTYYSPQSPETGWATVLPQQQYKSYASMLAKDVAGRAKEKAAEDKLAQQQLAKLTGNDIGRFHKQLYANEAEKAINNWDKMDTYDREKSIMTLNTMAQATKDIEKNYDADIKWSASKDIPVKAGEYKNWYTKKYYMNPSMENVRDEAGQPPDRAAFLYEDGGSAVIDGNKATKQVIKANFDGFSKDVSEWERSNWDKAPIGYVADLRTLQTKVQAFSKYDAATNSVVMKSADELIGDNILDSFMEDEFTKRILTDKAKENLMKATGKESIDDADLTESDYAEALSQELMPYVKGVISERGMSLTIRPSGGGGAKSQEYTTGIDLWVQQLSQGSLAAVRYPSGGKWGQTNTEVVSFMPFGQLVSASGGPSITGPGASAIAPGASISVNTDPASVRRNFANQGWFKGLTGAQQESIIKQTVASGSGMDKAKAAYTVVLRTPTKGTTVYKQGVATEGPTGWDYEVITIDPETTDRSTLAKLYDAGYGASGNKHYNQVVGNTGEKQAGYQYEQAPAWNPIPSPPQPKKTIMK